MLLITGATGLVGGMLARKLPGKIVGLARRPENGEAGLSWVRGDLATDGLGFDAATCRWLEQSVTGIVHCAAEVRFTLPLAEARQVNVAGTARLLEFARRCRKLRRFAHVSTVYVLGAEQGTLPESRAQSTSWISTYEQSKFEAETLVLDAAGTLPAAVYRLSSIIGDAATGRVRQFNYAHQMLRLMPRHLLPAIPGDAEARMDLIPSEESAVALAYLIRSRCEPGTVWNVCAGSQKSWMLGEIIEHAVRAYHAHGYPIRGPRLIAAQEFAAMMQRFSKLSQELATIASNFLPHLAMRQTFACERTHETLERAGIELPHIRSYFDRVMNYCFESEWGNRPIPEAAESGSPDAPARSSAADFQAQASPGS